MRRPVTDPPCEASTLAVAAASATGIALAGVDLLPGPHGGWTVLELNGAVEFSAEYAPWGDVFVEAARALAREVEARRDLWAAFEVPTVA